jgi:signal transduction histidine kinase
MPQRAPERNGLEPEALLGILNGLRAGVIAADLDDRVVYGNRAAAQILRIAPAGLIGRRLRPLLGLASAPATDGVGGPSAAPARAANETRDALDASEAREAMPAAMGRSQAVTRPSVVEDAPADAAEESERREVSCRRFDGTVAALGVSVEPQRDERGAIIGWVALFADIGTVLALRRERDRLLQMAALGDALPSVLHELRNPLAAITAMLEVRIEESSGALAEDYHALLVQVRRMTLGLDGLGSMVRPVGAHRHAAIDHAVAEAVRLLEPSARQRGIHLEAIGPTLPLLPLASGPITGMVFNLVRNAIDATRAGGNVTVDTHLEGRDFVLSVVDDGSGMSPETLARACDLFFTSKDKGSGIGLALCRRVAESSGGALDIESQLGLGTRVTVRIPLDGAASTFQ